MPQKDELKEKLVEEFKRKFTYPALFGTELTKTKKKSIDFRMSDASISIEWLYQALTTYGDARETKVRKRLAEANGILRSTFAIASRNGEKTNWKAFAKVVYKELKEQHKMLHPKITHDQNNKKEVLNP